MPAVSFEKLLTTPPEKLPGTGILVPLCLCFSVSLSLSVLIKIQVITMLLMVVVFILFFSSSGYIEDVISF